MEEYSKQRNKPSTRVCERTALSKKPDELIAQELATLQGAERMSPALVMRDPYILDFLGLRDPWQETEGTSDHFVTACNAGGATASGDPTGAIADQAAKGRQ